MNLLWPSYLCKPLCAVDSNKWTTVDMVEQRFNSITSLRNNNKKINDLSENQLYTIALILKLCAFASIMSSRILYLTLQAIVMKGSIVKHAYTTHSGMPKGKLVLMQTNNNARVALRSI